MWPKPSGLNQADARREFGQGLRPIWAVRAGLEGVDEDPEGVQSAGPRLLLRDLR